MLPRPGDQPLHLIYPLVTVLDSPILRFFNAFPSGSDQILKDFRPMLAKVARELKNDTSRIEVIGHMCDPL